MTSIGVSLQRLSVEAEKAASGAAAAKALVHSAKAELKKARKLSKSAKKAAKLARKKVEAALAAAEPAATAKPSKSPKPGSSGARRAALKAGPRGKGLHSAAQVAKAVITRMSVSAAQAEIAAAALNRAEAPPDFTAPARSGVIETASATVE